MRFIENIFTAILICFSVHLAAQPADRVCAEVKVREGVPSLYIDGIPQAPYAYMSYLGEEKFYREIASTGVHLYNIPAYLGDKGINSVSGIGPFRSSIWIGKDQYDFSSITVDFEKILQADPEAKVIIRIHLDPPTWWEKKNPDDVSRLPDGTGNRVSFASEKWQREAGEVLKHTVEWLLGSSYAAHLVGIHVAGGGTEEWFYHYKDLFYDGSIARKEKFRKWLRMHYENNIDSLRRKWNDNTVTFDDAIPADISGTDRENGWRNTQTDQWYFDTFDFQAETMADHIAYFCRIVKEASDNCLLTGAFYGYHYFVSDPRRGHGALAKLLDCPDLDYLSSPNDYNRVAGEDWAPMAAIKSVQLHGKLWLAENDTRTSISTLLKDQAPEIDPSGDWYKGGVWLGPKDMETSVSFLWKNLARMLAYGYGGWWFDMWGGWFSNPALLNVIQKAQAFYVQYPPTAYPQMRPEVAVIVDERLQFWDKQYGKLTGKIISNRYALGKTGAPYDLYLRTDLEAISRGSYKVVWMLGIMEPSSKELSTIKELRREGITVMYTDGQRTIVYDGEKGQPLSFEGKLQFSASELANIWTGADVHRYLDSSEDVVYAGRGWIGIHSPKGGTKRLKLPFYADIIDPLQQTVIAHGVNKLDIEVKPGSTSLYRVVPSKN